MTLQELVEAGYSAGQAADALGITRSAAAGRAWRLGLSFHGDDPGGTRKPRANQFSLKRDREEHARSVRRQRREERRRRELEAAEAAARRQAQFRKPGRIVAMCGWIT